MFSLHQREKEGWTQESKREMERGKKGRTNERKEMSDPDSRRGTWDLRANETVKISPFRSEPEQT